MVYRFEFELGTVEAEIVGRAMSVDIRQFPLRIGKTTIDPVRFVKLARLVYEDLEGRRLSVRGELHRSVRTAFELLGRQRVSVSVSGSHVEDGALAVLAATDGAQALTITQRDGADALKFVLLPDEDLVDVLAKALPWMAAAPTGPLTAKQHRDRPRSAMAARRQAEAEFDREETEAFGSLQIQQALRSRRSSPAGGSSDEEQLEEILSRPRLGGGHFSASGWGRHGQRRGTTPVSWLDIDEGRYLVYTRNEGGMVAARYVPAGAADVADAVQQVISAVY